MQLLFGIAALFLPDHHNWLRVEESEAAHHRRIVAKEAIAMQFGKSGEDAADVIGGMRPFGMARELHSLPGRIRDGRSCFGFVFCWTWFVCHAGIS